MNIILKIFLIVSVILSVVVFIWSLISLSITMSSFEEYCVNEYHGFVSGGNCIYIINGSFISFPIDVNWVRDTNFWGRIKNET
jgi:hypothetical protein